MAAALHAELSADGRTIVLIGTGTDGDIAHMAKWLQLATPLIKPSDPPGALVLGATWAAVVQLSHMFGKAWRPGPRLAAWVANEMMLRTAFPDQLSVTPPEGCVPRRYQVDGALMIAATGRGFLFDDPGCISGDAVMAINRAGKGFSVKLRDLVHRFNGGQTGNGRCWHPEIPTYVQREVDGVVRLGRVKNAWSSGVKTTYTVTTETGRTIRATDEHPFLTEHGWLRLDELTPGTHVHVRGDQAKGNPREAKPRYREIAGLRRHPHAHRANAKHSPHRVAHHRLVAEARINGLTYDEHVRRVRAGATMGLLFLDPATQAVHHIDLNPTNNAPENLRVMWHHEHHSLHAELGKKDAVLFKVVTERVVSVERFGEEETFDIEVADDPHNFLANSFVVHNTGKTITTILGLAERALFAEVFPVVCIVPASVVDPWVDAWRKWAPQFRAVAWRGDAKRRKGLSGLADVYAVSYDTARNDAGETSGPLVKLGARSIVIDECHLIKSQNAWRSKAARRLAKRADNFAALSGTPITHNPSDLFPALECLEPLAWPSKERMVDRYCTKVPGDYKEQILGLAPHTEAEFRLTLLGQHRRVSKADVLPQLPPKVYSVRTVELPPAYRKAYDQMEHDMLAQLPDGGELSVMSVLAQLTRLNQLASAAADVTVTYEPGADGEERDHVKVSLRAPSWKVDALLEVLEERPGEPVVAFAPSRQLMTLAGGAAEKAGLAVGYVVGGQSMTERTETVEHFQKGKLDLLCATTGAGGVGLTLTAAKTVVFLQRPWSIVEALQAEDRCHRIGSEHHDSIEIIDIVAADTVDTRVRAALYEKAGQLADLLQDVRIVTELLGGIQMRKLKAA